LDPEDSMSRDAQQLQQLNKLLKSMEKFNASDLHMKVSAQPALRVRGALRTVDLPAITTEDMNVLVAGIVSDQVRRRFGDGFDLDFSYTTDDGTRFRVNLFRQRGEFSMVFRRVTTEIKTFEELNLPKVLERLSSYRQGLVIVSGITGCGKSTTLASMVRYVNERRRCHIITVEDPIEYLHSDIKAFVNQREIGMDVDDYQTAAKFALRQDPDVILIGEMRDAATFQTVLTAAETGHLVFTTLHTSRAHQAITRILDLFPPNQHHQIRRGLCFNLRAVVCQMLLPAIKEGADLVPATEIMIVNPPIRKLISDGEDARMGEVMTTSGAEGMHDFTQSFAELVSNHLVEKSVALEAAHNPEAVEMALKGITAETRMF